jgi:hypothetical protein
MVGLEMVVVCPAVGFAGRERQLGGLAEFVAQQDAEDVAELQVLVLHANLLRSKGRLAEIAKQVP